MLPPEPPERDYIAGAESATELVLVVACPSCCASHPVTLSTLGRFAFHCGGTDMAGAVAEKTWQTLRWNGVARGPGQASAVEPTAAAEPGA